MRPGTPAAHAARCRRGAPPRGIHIGYHGRRNHMSTTQLTRGAERRARHHPRTRPLMGWRTVDLLTIAFLGAAFGVAYWGWGVVYSAPGRRALGARLPAARRGSSARPGSSPGVVGGLVVRRPGAALFCEVRRRPGLDAPRHQVGRSTLRRRASCRASAPSWRSPSSATAPSASPRRPSPVRWRRRSRPSTSGSPTGRTGRGAGRSPTCSSSRRPVRSSPGSAGGC